MDRDEIEQLLLMKLKANEITPGLFDTGLAYVALRVTDGQAVFDWFDSMTSLDSIDPL